MILNKKGEWVVANWPAWWPTKPGSQPENQIAATAAEQLARIGTADYPWKRPGGKQ
jgi:hypothetical protein